MAGQAKADYWANLTKRSYPSITPGSRYFQKERVVFHGSPRSAIGGSKSDDCTEFGFFALTIAFIEQVANRERQ
jgi:hypothetical protein